MKKGIVITGERVLFIVILAYSVFLMYTLLSNTFELAMLVPYCFFAAGAFLSKFEHKIKLLEIRINKDN
ncbi:hypothetical protein ACS60R_09955 [Streptococcus suis]